MVQTSSCPDTERWQRLLLGQLSVAEALELHLAECSTCRQAIRSAPTDDALVEAMRSQALSPDTTLPESVPRLIQRLKGLRSASATPRAEPARDTYDFLAPAEAPGEIGRLGPYRVLRVLGVGGMSVVFLAEDPHLKRLVALKVLKPALAASDTARQRFLREAQAMAALEHDHIVPIYQVGEERSFPFLAMPFLKGETLEDRLQSECRLPMTEVLRIGREMAEGLAAAHQSGLIHRDIKPSNVWLEDQRGRVKLLDFGLARAVADDVRLTQPGTVTGTPAYMAPEQAAGQTVDARVDLFSLGSVFYRMCTGEVPFKGASTTAILLALERDQPKPPRELNPETSQALSDLVLKLLAKDPAQRYPSAWAVIEALEAVQDGTTAVRSAVRSLALPAGAPAAPRSNGRRWWPLGVAAALLLAVLGPAGALFAPAVIRIATNKGALVIETDQEVQILLKQGGQQVRVLETGTNRAFDVTAGEYGVEIAEVPEGIRVAGPKVTLSRNGQVVLNARLELALARAKQELANAKQPEKTRNPFKVQDVPDPDGEDVKDFAATKKLPLDAKDANAEQWAVNATAGKAASLEGEWYSRWNEGDGEDWQPGLATVKVVGDRVYILHKDFGGTSKYLIELRREGRRRLVGRYLSLADPEDSTPWVGVVVDDERIDGIWDGGRWDLRRKLPAE